MSPLDLLELVGPAIGLHGSETLNRAFLDRFKVSPNLKAVVEASKRGFYVYDSGKPELDPEVAALLKQGDSVLTEEQVRARVLDAVAQEIGLMLDEGVVAEAQDIGLCLITGAGRPFHMWRHHAVPGPRGRVGAGEGQEVPGSGRGVGSGVTVVRS